MLLDKIFRRSLENPATPINDQTLSEAIGSLPTAAGPTVTPLSSLRCAAVYACVRVIAETIATLPLHIYEMKSDGSRALADGRSDYRILRDSPNSAMTSVVFREVVQAHALLAGNGYAEIEWSATGALRALWPIHSSRVTPILLPSGEKKFRILQENGGYITLDDEDVLHIPALSMDGIVGLSPIKTMRQSIGMALAAEEFGGRLFSNGLRASGVMTVQGQLSDNAYARMKQQLNEQNVGLSNAAKPMLLEEGAKWETISISPDDAQFLETRKFQTNEIASMFRVPPHMIGMLDKTTVGNVENRTMGFVKETIMPWLVRWEQELNRKLFPRGPYFCRFDLDELQRGDLLTRYRAYGIGRQWGWLSVNDIRRSENTNTVPDGDIYLQPVNMTPAGETPDDVISTTEEDDSSGN